MKTYKAYLQQDGIGCDYTIGCSQTVIDIKANSMEEARLKLELEIQENYSHYDMRLKNAELYDVVQVISLNMNHIYTQYDKAKNKEIQLLKEEKEREEYERLKAKYNPDGKS
ncbi:MAG TPA: hypothetical protein PKD00_03200 [Burkholderiales bacterium]|nr:hypothetical protein [Burkholderiales bacterium]